MFDGGVEDGPDAKMSRVALQVLDQLGSRRIFQIAPRHRQSRKAGMSAIGMQVKAVIVPPPDRADGIFLLQDRGTQANGTHAGGAGEACGSGPDNDYIRILHRASAKLAMRSLVNERCRRTRWQIWRSPVANSHRLPTFRQPLYEFRIEEVTRIHTECFGSAAMMRMT